MTTTNEGVSSWDAGIKRTGRRAFLAGGSLAALVAAGAVGGIAGSVITAAEIGTSAPVAHAGPALVARVGANTDTDIASLYRQVGGAVVSVQTASAIARPRSGRSQVPSGVVPTGEGSGFIVDGDGTVLTNFHVIDGADRLSVTLMDGTVVDAKVVGSDASSDIAVLHAEIPADRVVVATLGDSDLVQPGQLAVAIGTPFGLDHTITAGIVSAVGREFGTTPGGRPARNLIQTDAPINPGNSGGPLFNAAGEVIGVTTSIESPVRGSVGIGFAVPVNRARSVLAQVRAGKSADPAWLGVAVGALTPSVASSLNVPSSVTAGVVLSQVVAGGPAAKAGLRGSTDQDGSPNGDVVVAVDGTIIRRTSDLTSYLDRRAPGDVVTVTIYRDGKRSDVKVTLGSWPQASS
jgi:S1-C subfamily serine protease